MRVVFGECEFDSARRVLLRHGSARALSPKAFELLELLLDRRPEVVAKTEILERLWPETFVSDASLHNAVAEIRAALGDAPRAARYIRTVPRYGYAFHGDARLAPALDATATRRSGPRLVSAQGEWFLADGANVVGRDPRVCRPRRFRRSLAPPRPDPRDACGDDDRGSGQQERNTGERRANHASRSAQRQRPDPGRLRRDDLSNRGHASIHAYPAASVRQQRMTSRVELDINVRQAQLAEVLPTPATIPSGWTISKGSNRSAASPPSRDLITAPG